MTRRADGFVCAGTLSSAALLTQLALDRVVPLAFLRTTPRTGSHYVAIVVSIAFAGLVYASAAGQLGVISDMYAPPLTSMRSWS